MAAECDGLLDYDDNDDAKAREKDAALSSALSRLSGDFGRESMMSMQRFSRSRRPPVISTGSLKLDLALGIGGLPKVIKSSTTHYFLMDIAISYPVCPDDGRTKRCW